MTQPEKPKDLLDWLCISESPRWMVSRPLGALVSVVLTLLLTLALAAAVNMLAKIFPSTPETPGGNLGTSGLIVALLGAPFLIWNTIIKQKALGFQKEGHLTDRISKAVEHLGAEKTVKRPGADGTAVEQTEPNIEVRIGGILSLERIAQDSCTYDGGRDHVRVMEILCAYVRENAPASGVVEHAREPSEVDERVRGILPGWLAEMKQPREDIAQVLHVIGRRNTDQLRVEARWGKTAAPDADWVFNTDCPMLPASAEGTMLTGSVLSDHIARLTKWSSVVDSYRGYRLDLRKTNLQMADLSAAVLCGARLDGARMARANLYQAKLTSAQLRGASLEAAFLLEAKLNGADLSSACLDDADLRKAHLKAAILSYILLTKRTRFREAVLDGAEIFGVNLALVPITVAQITPAFLGGVELPDDMVHGHMDWPTHWPKGHLDRSAFRNEYRKWRENPAAYTPPPPP